MAAIDNIRDAVAGKTGGKEQLAAVVAGDVIEACGLVPASRRNRVTEALLAGASSVKEEAEVYQKVIDLRHLLELAGTPPIVPGELEA